MWLIKTELEQGVEIMRGGFQLKIRKRFIIIMIMALVSILVICCCITSYSA